MVCHSKAKFDSLAVVTGSDKLAAEHTGDWAQFSENTITSNFVVEYRDATMSQNLAPHYRSFTRGPSLL